LEEQPENGLSHTGTVIASASVMPSLGHLQDLLASHAGFCNRWLVNSLDPPDTFHLSAAIGWLELGNWQEANEELRAYPVG
jgi:hypothetical protein